MEPHTILLVEDDPFQRRLLHAQLIRLGYTVLEAINGIQGLEILQNERVDLVVTDWTMPELDGAALCSRIRQTSPVPVLMLTDKGEQTDIVAGLDAGADDYMVKPVDTNELRARIASLMRKSLLIQSSFKQNNADSVIRHFDFPEAAKNACEQYLLYFVEFLKDVGIDATAELREDAGQVLFSITPKDKDEALDNIREALEIYLRLPMNRNTTVVISPETSIEVQKLSAQIHHLQGQLYLASAALQQKELTIQQRDTTIEHQQALIQQHIATGQVLVQALQREDVDSEPVIGDIIKVKTWSADAIPFEVDLPTLMRQLKEMFRRKRLP